MKSLQGLWQFERNLEIECFDCPPENLNYSFRIQDESIVLQVLQFAVSEDVGDPYLRLACRFENSILAYRSPNGEWTDFVKLQGEQLLCGENGKVQAFVRIFKEDLDADELGLLKERNLFTYEG